MDDVGAFGFLLPYRSLELRSALSPGEAARALSAMVGPPRWFRFARGGPTFEGTVSEAGFDIERIIRYRNSFVPRVRGQIRADALGSVISVKMQLAPPVAIFMGVFQAFAALGVVVGVFTAVMGRSGHEGMVVSFGLLSFGLLLTAFGFAFEAMKAERLLCEIFQATAWRPGVHPSYGAAKQ